MSESLSKLPLANKLLYTCDMAGSQAIAQTRNLWLLFFFAPPKGKNMPDAVPGLSLGPLDPDARVFVEALLTAGRNLLLQRLRPLCTPFGPGRITDGCRAVPQCNILSLAMALHGALGSAQNPGRPAYVAGLDPEDSPVTPPSCGDRIHGRDIDTGLG